jgi:hypothetical protein
MFLANLINIIYRYKVLHMAIRRAWNMLIFLHGSGKGKAPVQNPGLLVLLLSDVLTHLIFLVRGVLTA